MPLRRVEGIRNRGGGAFRLKLIRTGWALGQLPFVVEQVLEEVVAPVCRRLRPGDFRSARDCVPAFACAELALPAEAHLLNGRCFGFWADELRIASAMGLAETMSAGDERNRLLVVHRHALEGLANIDGRGERVGLAVRPFRVHIDETHLHGGERILELAVARVALVAEPGILLAPVDGFVRLPHIGAAAAEAERLET